MFIRSGNASLWKFHESKNQKTVLDAIFKNTAYIDAFKFASTKYFEV